MPFSEEEIAHWEEEDKQFAREINEMRNLNEEKIISKRMGLSIRSAIITAIINFIATMIIFQIITALEIFTLLSLSGQVVVASVMSLFVGIFAFSCIKVFNYKLKEKE